MDSFDYLFYLDLYPDLRQANIKSSRGAYNHYKNFGKAEGRICNKEQMLWNLENGEKEYLKEAREYVQTTTDEHKINILIRTSNRERCFRKCIKSILDQGYENYQVYICYDKDESLTYLRDYANDAWIRFFPISIESKEKYKFNLYCNELMDKVDDGFIMFLDDDDMLCHCRVFQMINDALSRDEESICVWKFLRPDKVIYPKDVTEIKLGEITTSGFAFHSKHKMLSRWPDKQCGDYAFFSGLQEHLAVKPFDYILTKTVDQVIGHFGS